MQFRMQNLNAYEVSQDTLSAGATETEEQSMKHVEIKQKDIVYNNQQCSMLIMNDMTAFAKLDQERMNNVSLQRTNACISHEIITPLRTIELMCKKLLPECTSKMSKVIHSILNGAKFMEFSVRNTLKFSRM